MCDLFFISSDLIKHYVTVYRIRFILICGFGSVIADPLPGIQDRLRIRLKIEQIPIYFSSFFSLKGIKLITIFFVIYELIIHVY